MNLTQKPLVELLAAFRDSNPTPGGGSASALAGAIGASLLAMVAALPKPRATTQEDTARLHAAGSRCSALAERLTALIDDDAEAYNAVVAAYRLSKMTEQDQIERASRIQQALRAAIEVPLEVMRACRGATEQAGIVANLGSRNAASDVGVALELLGAGVRGARLNVEVNLESVKDAEYAASVNREASRLAEEADRRIATHRSG